MTIQYYIEVMHGGTVLATGILTVVIDTSKTPPQITGSFTPTGGTEVTCNISTWNPGPNGAVAWSFELTAANGDFPIKANGGAFTYQFTGNGTNPAGQVNWPDSKTMTWQSEARI